MTEKTPKIRTCHIQSAPAAGNNFGTSNSADGCSPNDGASSDGTALYLTCI